MMFTYRVALLNALGINYESLSELLVLQGKQYTRGPSFATRDYRKATEYCLMNNVQGLTCILVHSATELTAWLHQQNSESVERSQIGKSKAVTRIQQSSQQRPQQTPDSKFQMTYRGVKYVKY